MASYDNDRRELCDLLEAGLGPRGAALLMSHLPPIGWADLDSGVAVVINHNRMFTVGPGEEHPFEPLIRALPLTAVNDALRASMLEGAGLTRLAPELAIVAVWLVVTFALAVRLFRWR